MRTTLVAVGLFVFASQPSAAAPVCLPGTLAGYIALGAGGCDLGPATVSNFSSAALLVGATEILPGDVLVTPVAGAVALDFGVNAAAGPGDLLDILIRYTLSGASFTANSLSMSGSSATDDGVVTAVEDKCLGGLFAGADPTTPCAGDPLTLIVVEDQFGLISPESASFPATSFFDVFAQITVDGGVNGTAALDGTVRTSFSGARVPEPSILLVLGSGLAWFAARRRVSVS